MRLTCHGVAASGQNASNPGVALFSCHISACGQPLRHPRRATPGRSEFA